MGLRKKPITPEAARLRMADLCSRSEYSSGEILEKLRKLGVSFGESRKIVDELIEGRFIDDTRFARAYSNDKLRFAGWGPLKIRAGLYAKRVGAEEIRDALEQLDKEDIMAAALKAGQAKSRQLNLSTREDCMKLLRFLAARGFPGSICTKVLEVLRKG